MHHRAPDMKEYLVIIRDNFCQFCTKCCDPSSEPSKLDGSNEGSQHMVSKIISQLSSNTPHN